MPNQPTIDPSPNRRPLGRQLCLPISPTSRKTPAPSCSRLLTLPRPPTRLRARPSIPPSPKLRRVSRRRLADTVPHYEVVLDHAV